METRKIEKAEDQPNVIQRAISLKREHDKEITNLIRSELIWLDEVNEDLIQWLKEEEQKASSDTERTELMQIVYDILLELDAFDGAKRTHFVPLIEFKDKWVRHRDYIRLTYQPDSDDFQLILFTEQFFIKWEDIINANIWEGGGRNCTLSLFMHTHNPFIVIEKPIWAAHRVKESFLHELHEMLIASFLVSIRLGYEHPIETYNVVFPQGIAKVVKELVNRTHRTLNKFEDPISIENEIDLE